MGISVRNLQLFGWFAVFNFSMLNVDDQKSLVR